MTRRKRMLDDLEQDIRDHIERETQDNIDRGMSPEEARYAAVRKFGNVTNVKEETRDVWSLIWLEQILEDIRFGLRLLRKNPGFTAVAVLTLALGIGANAAVFSVVYAVLLRPLPYKDPSRLVVLHETTPRVGDVSVSFQDFIDWRAASHTFAQMAAVQSVDFNLAGVTQPENINGDAVSPNFLSMIGVRPFLGRDFDASEEKAGTAPVLLLSYSLWQSHLGGDPNAVGKTITLDGRTFTIVGVLPPNYRSLDTTDVMLPIGVWATNNADAVKERGDRGDMVVIGRLAPGVAFGQARAEMEGIAARLAKEYPGEQRSIWRDAPADSRGFRWRYEDRRSWCFLVRCLFVLLIACANVANLFLVRGASRTKEIALRIAFGASRGRIIRQMLTESFILACFGGVVGVALAMGGIRGMAQLIPTDMLSGATVNLNGAVLLFVAGVVALAAFIFGLAPALHSTKPDVQSELKEGGRTSSGGVAQNRLRGALAIAEISLALILLIGAGLMMKSLYRLLQVDPGFRPDRVLTMGMDLRAQQYSQDPAVLNFWQQLLDRVSALPGVQSAAVGTMIPSHRQPQPLRRHDRGNGAAEAGELSSSGCSYRQPGIHCHTRNPAASRPKLHRP